MRVRRRRFREAVDFRRWREVGEVRFGVLGSSIGGEGSESLGRSL